MTALNWRKQIILCEQTTIKSSINKFYRKLGCIFLKYEL